MRRPVRAGPGGAVRCGAVPSLLAMALSLSLTACASAGRRDCGTRDVSATLVELRAVTDSAAAALPRATDPSATVLRTRLRDAVERTASLELCGALVSAAQWRDAGAIALVAAGAGTQSIEQAYRWARRAVELDVADRGAWRVLAESWDQWQVQQHNAQWFATVITCAPGTEGLCALETLDTSRVTDAQRVEIGLRTLLQQQQRVDSLNRARRRS